MTFDPGSDGGSVVLLLGPFWQHVLCPRFPREEKVTAHHYEAALSVHLRGVSHGFVSRAIALPVPLGTAR